MAESQSITTQTNRWPCHSQSPLKQTDGRVTITTETDIDHQCHSRAIAEPTAIPVPVITEAGYYPQSRLIFLFLFLFSCRSHDCNKTDVPFAVTIKEPTSQLQRKRMEKQYCAAYEDRDDENDDERRECATVVGRCLEIKSGICLPLQSLVQMPRMNAAREATTQLPLPCSYKVVPLGIEEFS